MDLLDFNSIGGTALKVGSVKVSTLNLARLALQHDTEQEYLIALKDLVELDFWKVDYSPILRIPPSEEFRDYTPANEWKGESNHSSFLQRIKQFVKGIIG